jgi:CRP-like cAMP-binding protein/thioredoxin reductase/Fe-S-cluster-containing hydrogenase component 2
MDVAYDVIIIGGGPAGLSAALSAHRNGLRYLLLEKENHVADTAYRYQKGKLVMAEPSAIPLQGGLWLEPSSREEVLQHWEDTVRNHGLNILPAHCVERIDRGDGIYQVRAGEKIFNAPRVILAIGSQGNPRKLGVPGEDLPHVITRLVDPELHRNQDIVVVGGGDSAIEIAVALAARNRVTLSVRTAEFIRAKESQERCALEMARRGQLTIHFNSSVEEIKHDSVTLRVGPATVDVTARFVFAKIGTLPPRAFLEKCGVGFPSSDAAAFPIIGPTYETEAPGLFVVGAASGRGDLIKHAINQGHEVIEHLCGRQVEPADESPLKDKLHFLQGSVAQRIQELLPKLPLLARGTETQLRELLLAANFHHVAPAGIVFRQNDYSESLYMIMEGTLEVLAKLDGAPPVSVATLGPGEFFGEMSLISGRRRSATIRAVSNAFLCEVDRKAMLKFIHTAPAAKAIIDQAFLVRAFQTYLLPRLDHAVLRQIAERAKVFTFDRNQVVLREGEEGDSFYLIRSGMVKLSRIRQDREIVLLYLSAGQYFGEISLLSGSPRVATVTTIDRVEVIRLAREDFLACLDSSPELKQRLELEAERRRMRFVEMEVRPELAEMGRFMTAEEVVVGDNVLLIDENRCVDCDQCVRACESVHEDGQTRLKRTGMKFANVLVANSCRHCENPLCMTDCPPGDAIARDPRGEVFIRDNCIGCGHCAANCPYDNIFMVHEEERRSAWDWLRKAVGAGTADTTRAARSFPVKCDLCRDLKGGPACVRSCPTGAVLRLTPAEYKKTVEDLVLARKEIL